MTLRSRVRPNAGTIALVLVIAVSGCKESDPEQAAWKALQKGKHARAASLLEQAMADYVKSDPKYVALAVGRCQALAFSDPEESHETYRALVANSEFELQSKDHKLIVRSLLDAEAYQEAVKAADFAKQEMPDDGTLLELCDKVISMAKKRAAAGDAELDDLLKGMGYGG